MDHWQAITEHDAKIRPQEIDDQHGKFIPKFMFILCIANLCQIILSSPNTTEQIFQNAITIIQATCTIGMPVRVRLTKAYDVTIQRYRNSHAKIQDCKMYNLQCMSSKFCV